MVWAQDPPLPTAEKRVRARRPVRGGQCAQALRLKSRRIGAAVRTRLGQAFRERMETSLFERVPGYALFRSLTQQLAGEGRENVWKPALVEIEEALVPAFIIEELDDGRFTIVVPSVPTPLAGAHARVAPGPVPADPLRAVDRSPRSGLSRLTLGPRHT